MASHLHLLHQTWKLLDRLTEAKEEVVLDGESLSLAAILAVSRYSAKAKLSQSNELVQRLQESVDTLTAQLEQGHQVYGVNTGCGGNANTRTKRLQILQYAFFQHHQAGILPDLVCPEGGSLFEMDEGSHSLPPDIARGTILLRCNSLLRGHSAVRLEVINFLLRVLNEGYVPIIPLRGSISASGDLSPLSYIGGLIEGNNDIFVKFKENEQNKIFSAAEVLQRLELNPTKLNPKEGLGAS